MRQYVWNCFKIIRDAIILQLKNNQGKGEWERKVKGDKIGQELGVAASAHAHIGGLLYSSSFAYVWNFHK